MANCDVRLRGAHAARVREDEAKRAAPPRLYSCYYDAGTRRSRIEWATEKGYFFARYIYFQFY